MDTTFKPQLMNDLNFIESQPLVIQTTGLSKTYKDVQALQPLDLVDAWLRTETVALTWKDLRLPVLLAASSVILGILIIT